MIAFVTRLFLGPGVVVVVVSLGSARGGGVESHTACLLLLADDGA